MMWGPRAMRSVSRSHEPREVLETPRLLHYVPASYNRKVLDSVMLSLETQVADEWSELSTVADLRCVRDSGAHYPHWRSGTLPLAPHVKRLFPTARITDRIRFTFVDDVTGKVFPGWVVQQWALRIRTRGLKAKQAVLTSICGGERAGCRQGWGASHQIATSRVVANRDDGRWGSVGV